MCGKSRNRSPNKIFYFHRISNFKIEDFSSCLHWICFFHKIFNNSGQFFRVISEHNVAGCFLTPTAVRAIKAADINATEGAKYDVSSLRAMFIAGEPCDLNTRIWAEKYFKAPVLNNWWQTETAHAITATCVGLGNHLNPPNTSAGKPVPGFDIRVLDEDGKEAGVGNLGRIVCKLPLAPGTMSTLFKADQRFNDTYFSDYKGK